MENAADGKLGEPYLQKPMPRSFFGSRILARHGRSANNALNLARVDSIYRHQSLRGKRAVLVLLVAKLLDNDGQGADSLPGNVFGLLAR